MSDEITVKSALEEAKSELREEKQTSLVKKFKAKLGQVDDAEQIVRNLKRELEEMEHELGQL